MKYLPFFLLLTFSSFSQKLPDNITIEIDEFTQDTIIKADWVMVNPWSKGNLAYFQFISIQGVPALRFKVVTGEVTSVHEGDIFYVMFEDGDVLQLHALESMVTERGAGTVSYLASDAFGLSLIYLLDPDDLNAFCTKKIDKLRLDTTDGKLIVEPSKDKLLQEVIMTGKQFQMVLKYYYGD